MIKFPMIHIHDKTTDDAPVLLGSNKHHILMTNETGDLSFLNLQNHDMSGIDGNYEFVNDPDNEDMLPLVSFDTLMHEIEPLLDLNDKDKRSFGKAVAIINDLIDQAEQKETKRLNEIIGQSVDVYLKNKALTTKTSNKTKDDSNTPVKATDVSVFDNQLNI